MVTQERLYTADEYWQIVSAPENENRQLELINGVIYQVNPPRPLHVYVSGRAFWYIYSFVEAHDLGFVTGETGGFELSPDNVLIPDVGFITKERLPSLPDDKITIAPDLAIEVVSVSNRPREILDKVETYLRYGTRLVWVIYPDKRVGDIYRRADDGGLHVRKFTENDTLDGEDVLPGFRLPVRDIFPKQ